LGKVETKAVIKEVIIVGLGGTCAITTN